MTFRIDIRAVALALVASVPAIGHAQIDEVQSRPNEVLMTAEAFENFVSGSTIYFNRRGQPYGAEQYLPDRRVIWTFLDGRCERGAWYNEGSTICFVYETQSEAQCWNFVESGGDKRARVVGADPANDLLVVGQDDANLDCPGPGIGVSYTPALPLN